MHLAAYLGLLCRAERDLAYGFRLVAEGDADDPDIYHLGNTLAAQCDAHAECLRPFADRYGEEIPDEPYRLREQFFGHGTRQGSLGLLRDLQDLFMMANECEISWAMVGQAAQGVGDAELLQTVEGCERQTATQIRWLRTRMKQSAPQALIAAS